MFKLIKRLNCNHDKAVVVRQGEHYDLKYCPDCNNHINYKRDKFHKVKDFSIPALVGTILTLLIISHANEVNATESNCTFIENLTPYQYDIAYQSYRAGQAYDLQLTAVAVAWQESKLGRYKFRWGKGVDKSVGIGHTVVKYKTQGMSALEAGIWVEKMITHDAKSINVMVSDLLYWQNQSGSWIEGVGKYNGGNTANMNYAREVAGIVKQIKSCKWG